MSNTMAVRKATTIWTGDLIKGSGTFTTGSGALDAQAVTWAARTESPEGKTSPEELIAAAHSSCYSMAFSAALGRNGTPPEELEVTAEVTLAKVQDVPTVVSSNLNVRARIPGLAVETFNELAEDAARNCPISRLLSAEINLEATLES